MRQIWQCGPLVGSYDQRHGLGAIQVLRNAVGGGGGGVSAFQKKSVTEVYGSTLLALRGGGWGSIFEEKSIT